MGRDRKSKIFFAEDGYDLHADYYDEKLKFLDSFEKDELKRMLKNIKGEKVLDIGCGTGRLVPLLRDLGCEITGVDVSGKMLEKFSQKYPQLKAVKGDIESLPCKDEEFDVVICAFVIVHLYELEKAFEEVYRVLKPGGTVIITNINQRKAPKVMSKEGDIVITSHYHMPKNVLAALDHAFFEIEEEVFVYEGKTWITQIVKGKK